MSEGFVFAQFPLFNLTAERYDALKVVVTQSLTDDFDVFMEQFEELKGKTLPQIVEIIMDAIERTSDGSHETGGTMHYLSTGEPFEMAVTGGMTYGDPPTEIFNSFELAGYFIDVYNKALEFAVDDQSELDGQVNRPKPPDIEVKALQVKLRSTRYEYKHERFAPHMTPDQQAMVKSVQATAYERIPHTCDKVRAALQKLELELMQQLSLPEEEAATLDAITSQAFQEIRDEVTHVFRTEQMRLLDMIRRS